MALNHAQYAEFIARNIEGANAAAEYARLNLAGRKDDARTLINAALGRQGGHWEGFSEFLLLLSEQNCDIASTLEYFTREMHDCLAISAADEGLGPNPFIDSPTLQ
jgi:hypothetical protein